MQSSRVAPAILALLAVAFAATACGQKGPLYLPGASPETVTPGASAGAEDDERQEEDDETAAGDP